MRAILVGVCVMLSACAGAAADGGGSAANGGGSAGGGSVGGGSAEGGGSAGGGSAGGGSVGGGSAGGGASGGAAAGGGAAGGGSAGGGATPSGCLVFDAGVGTFAGTTRTLMPGSTLKSLLMVSQPGDTVVVKGGEYPSETLNNVFAGDVLVQAAAGETPLFHGLVLSAASHLVFKGIHFDGTVRSNGAHEITFDGVNLDVGTKDISGLELFNSGAAGATHHFRVIRSRVAGGARTIFMGGTFTMEAGWNHHLEFLENEFICGTHNCFQLSGARDTVIEDNDFHDPKGSGVLTAGATRITIARNRMRGTKAVASSAVQLATPGTEWDNYAGVQWMTSTNIVVANNLMVNWGSHGIELDAVKGVQIVGNTVVNCTGINTWRRTPHDQQGNIILTGNTDLEVWNNVFPSIKLDTGDPRPTFESNNMVTTGGGGMNLVTGTPMFQDTVDYAPVSPGPAIDVALVNAKTPTVDRRGRPRGDKPDLGAFEVGAPACP